MHSRRKPIVDIAISKFRIPTNISIDDAIVQLYSKLYEGEIDVALTRLPVSAIISGHCERQGGETVILSNLNRQYIPLRKRAIRGGNRPLLDISWSPLAPGGGGYVCEDDETSLAAYSQLNFAWVPCRILRPKKIVASEASIWLEKQGDGVRLKRAVAPVVDAYPSFFVTGNPGITDLIGALIKLCERARSSIVSFHKSDGSRVHYHHMLHAVLRRHERLLDSISWMAELGRIEHAEALTRVAYEGFLNFYIDWLSLEFFGPRLQFLATIRSAQSSGERFLDSNLAVLNNFPEFLENTSEKARISPLESRFHFSIYPPLSLVAHQSYMHLEQEASSFHNNDLPNSSTRVKQLGRWLDVLTAALVIRISNDVGIHLE